jgi:aminoglycoside phosphotransferase family enzyme/predicted kinase
MRSLLDRLRSAPELGGEVEIVQTHISAVLLGRELALKLKKPVALGFVDYSTLSLRRAACEAEVSLNRRLCPELYVGVVPIARRDDTLEIGGGGDVVEYGVLMRRLPADRMLDRAVENGWVLEEHLDLVADTLLTFHAQARRGPDVDAFGAPSALRAKWDENLEQTAPFVGRTIDAVGYDHIRTWLDAWMARADGRLRSRVAAGRILEGHGDVRCESVCLVDKVAIFDCVEFNESFRCIDVACEIAFLAMDLAARGRPDLGYYVCDRYAAGAVDDDIFALLPFYQSYLAFVRGRVLSFESRLPETSPGARREAVLGARRYYALAVEYATPMPRNTLVCVAGLSGVGKTATARGIGHTFGARVVSADAVRHDLFGTGGLRGLEHGVGPYSPEANRRTYDAMLRRARSDLEVGRSVVLDATFRRAEDRRLAAALARQCGARLRLVECRVPADTARARIEERTARREGLSRATVVTYEYQMAELDPVTELPIAEHLVLDNTGPRAGSIRTACGWLRRDAGAGR